MAASPPGGSQKKKLAIAMAICAASLVSELTAATAAAALAETMAMNSPKDYVELHNAARAAAGAGPMSWDGEAARHAAKRAAAGCIGGLRSSRLAAVRTGGYGENMFHGTGTLGKAKAWGAADAMRAWTAPAATEYVQVVWPGSDRVGCAHAVCAAERGDVVISCSYKPAVKEELKGTPLPSYCRYNISRCADCTIC